MTPFEERVISLTEFQVGIAAASAAVAFLGVIVASVAGFLIYGQLRSSRWMTLLALEQDLAGRRDRFLGIRRRLKSSTSTDELQDEYNVQKESYLNAVERLASSILNGNFPEKEMKQDYRSYISDVVETFEAEFGAATRFRKIKKLYDRWQD